MSADAQYALLGADKSHEQRFLEFHRANPRVYQMLVSYTRQAKERGRKRVGMKALFERLRWDVRMRTDGEPFQLNNSFTAHYARLIAEREPDLADMFEFRGDNPPPQGRRESGDRARPGKARPRPPSKYEAKRCPPPHHSSSGVSAGLAPGAEQPVSEPAGGPSVDPASRGAGGAPTKEYLVDFPRARGPAVWMTEEDIAAHRWVAEVLGGEIVETTDLSR